MNRREFVKITAMAGASMALFKGFEGKAWAFLQSPVLRKFISPLPGLGTGLPIANCTLKKDGTIIPGDPSTAFDAAPSADPRLPIFTDLKVKTVLPANVETGLGHPGNRRRVVGCIHRVHPPFDVKVPHSASVSSTRPLVSGSSSAATAIRP